MTYRPGVMPGVEVKLTEYGNKRIPAQTIQCSSCERQNALISTKQNQALPQEACKKVWTNRGWHVDAKKGKHLCPQCRRKTERVADTRLKKIAKGNGEQKDDAMAIVEQATNEPQPTAKPAPAQTDPSELDLVSRRLIFRAIDEVYDENEQRYKRDATKPNNDQAIASDLGVPVEWVIQVREETFGPAGHEAATKEIEARIDALEQEAKQLRTDTDSASAKIANAIADLEKRMQAATEGYKAVSKLAHEVSRENATVNTRMKHVLDELGKLRLDIKKL